MNSSFFFLLEGSILFFTWVNLKFMDFHRWMWDMSEEKPFARDSSLKRYKQHRKSSRFFLFCWVITAFVHIVIWIVTQ